jgi:bacteriocin biosynthesis cyclodehydratase domain-containing protein
MRVATDGTTARLGSTIVPHHTAYYTCYDRRVRSHLPDLEGFPAYRERAAHTAVAPDEGTLAPLSTALAEQVAIEVARLLTGFASPTTIGRFHSLQATTPLVNGHHVLRLVRCPSCRPDARPREPWDGALAPVRGKR